MVPALAEGLAQVPIELTFEAFIYAERIKPLLKSEVNNETSFTSLRSLYEINITACYMQYIYFFSSRQGCHTKY